MIKKLLFLLFFIPGVLLSQTKEEALRDGKLMAEAILIDDYETVFKYTNKNVLALMGDLQAVIQQTKAQMSKKKAEGFKYEKSEVVEVSEVVFEQNQYRCYAKQELIVVENNKRKFSENYVLGIYDEERKVWTWIDAGFTKNPALMQNIYKGFSTDLKIPANTTKTEKLN